MQIQKYILECEQGIIEFRSIEERADYIQFNHISNAVLSERLEDIDANANREAEIALALQNAIHFGRQVSMGFLIENTILGIKTSDKIEQIRSVLDMPLRAIETGSLNEAINRLKAIPVEQRYEPYLSTERLLKYINRLEEYLGIDKTNAI